MYVAAIAGTYGKTCTELLLASVLEASQRTVAVAGDLGCNDGAQTLPNLGAPIQPTELARWLADSRANGCSHALVEVSSEALATRRTAGLQLDAAVFTNLRRDHVDLHGSVFNYRQAQTRLLDHLKPHGCVVLNADDPASTALGNLCEHPLLTVAMNSPAGLTAQVIQRHCSEQMFLLEAGAETAVVRTHVIGDHHVYNCLNAAAIGLHLGVDLATIVRGLERVTCLPGRLERIECGQPFGVFVDGGATVEALTHGLHALRRVTGGRLICVFGEGPPNDVASRPRRGGIVERLADMAILTCDNPRDDRPLQAAHDVLDGCDRPAQAHLMPNRIKAVCWALSQARAEDVVLLVGPHNLQSLGRQRRGDQDYALDRDVARFWLYRMAGKHACPWVPA
jgi:UDP-N-acetylmuramoyl-L-alanyl-D-glutamate--2,6-diaminopimelate ligase